MTYPPQPGPGNPQYPSYPPQAGYSHQPGYPGYPPRPPNRTGLVVGLVAGVVVLVAFGITGFVAPGFFLSDGQTQPVNDDEAAKQVIRTAVEKMGIGDAASVGRLACADSKAMAGVTVQALIAKRPSLTLEPMTGQGIGNVLGVAAGTVEGKPVRVSIAIFRQDPKKPCITFILVL